MLRAACSHRHCVPWPCRSLDTALSPPCSQQPAAAVWCCSCQPACLSALCYKTEVKRLPNTRFPPRLLPVFACTQTGLPGSPISMILVHSLTFHAQQTAPLQQPVALTFAEDLLTLLVSCLANSSVAKGGVPAAGMPVHHPLVGHALPRGAVAIFLQLTLILRAGSTQRATFHKLVERGRTRGALHSTCTHRQQNRFPSAKQILALQFRSGLGKIYPHNFKALHKPGLPLQH